MGHHDIATPFFLYMNSGHNSLMTHLSLWWESLYFDKSIFILEQSATGLTDKMSFFLVVSNNHY